MYYISYIIHNALDYIIYYTQYINALHNTYNIYIINISYIIIYYINNYNTYHILIDDACYILMYM